MLNIAFIARKILTVFTLRYLNWVFFNALFPYFEIRNYKFIAKHAYELLSDLLRFWISIMVQILDNIQLNMHVSLENMLKLLMDNFIQIFLGNMNFGFLNFWLNHMIKDDVWISRFLLLFFLNLLYLNLFYFLLIQPYFLFLLSLKVVRVIVLVLCYIHFYCFFSAAGSSHIFLIYLIILFITCFML